MHFNPAMRRIADILITDTQSLLNCSIGDIAEKSNVSAASVTRFVQILGYKNFKAFCHIIGDRHVRVIRAGKYMQLCHPKRNRDVERHFIPHGFSYYG